MKSFLHFTSLLLDKVSRGGGTESQCLLRCLSLTMNHEGPASWDHRRAFDKQAPECFCSQQAILTFAVRGRHASSQITHHSSQYSLCSVLSLYTEVSRHSDHMVQEVQTPFQNNILIFKWNIMHTCTLLFQGAGH